MAQVVRQKYVVVFFKNHDVCTNIAFREIISTGSKGNGLVGVKILTFTI